MRLVLRNWTNEPPLICLLFFQGCVFYNGYGVNFGLGFAGTLLPRLGLLTDLNVLLLPGMEEGFAFEHKNLLTWSLSNRTDIQVGYKLICGEYPFGVQWHLLPLLDILWRW